jgi:secreted PhoX family phosphatase
VRVVSGTDGSRRPLIGRRRFLGGALVGTAALAASPVRAALESLARSEATRQPPITFGPLGPPDAFGVRVPAGFRSTVVGRTGRPVGPTKFVWHAAPDGGACFPVAGSTDHVYVSNSEVAGGGGGASAVRIDTDGAIVGAWSVLSGTSRNCAGGATPWGTWLSCEERGPESEVYECRPLGGRARVRPALGHFNHEAAAVDPVGRWIYLTEDDPAGRLYRFRPDRWGDLTSGRLQAASVDGTSVSWRDVSADRPARSGSTSAFDGGEGIVVDGDLLFFTTKGDRRVWELDLRRQRLRVLHDAVARPGTALTHVDNVTVHPSTGQIYVAEDGGNVELCVVTVGPAGGPPAIEPVVHFEGHDGSEVTGPAFSPNGRSLYVSSQRGTDGDGLTVRVDGPFRPPSRIDGGAVATGHARRVTP